MNITLHPQPVSDLMDLNSACNYIGGSSGPVSRCHLYKLMRKHGLPARRIASRWMFSKAEIDAWITSRPGINLPQAG